MKYLMPVLLVFFGTLARPAFADAIFYTHTIEIPYFVEETVNFGDGFPPHEYVHHHRYYPFRNCDEYQRAGSPMGVHANDEPENSSQRKESDSPDGWDERDDCKCFDDPVDLSVSRLAPQDSTEQIEALDDPKQIEAIELTGGETVVLLTRSPHKVKATVFQKPGCYNLKTRKLTDNILSIYVLR